jgi:hypothetical protein
MRSMTCFWNCLFDFHTNIREIFTWSTSWHEQMACEHSYKSRCTFGQITPSEAALKQHSLRTSLQTQIWTTWYVAKPHIPSPLEYRWQKGKDSLQPVYVEGPMSADTLQDLVCSCNGTSPCEKSCVCFEENLACTDLCFCQGSEWCKHAQTHTLRENTSQ